ncbi:MAG: hypothetical protein JOZ81_14470 [Chloroflexi bacterium]|nr:hypothetical protein [Chloroflexota bacterium]MBV9547872.1 hypothetical protein [Chloroflexota bacterium]
MSTSAPLASDETLYCARHPGTETSLRCGRCFTPICPKCLVGTPVGARCPTCARVKRFSTVLKPPELARAAGFGVGAGTLGTMVISFLPLPGGFFSLLLYALMGYCVGEAVAIGANRKRAPELGPIAVACVFVGYVLGFVVELLIGGAPFSLGLLLVPMMLLMRGLLIVGLLIGALLAWMRVR